MINYFILGNNYGGFNGGGNGGWSRGGPQGWNNVWGGPANQGGWGNGGVFECLMKFRYFILKCYTFFFI